MQRRHRLAWKLSVAVLAIVSLVILGTGLVGSLLSRQYALNAARNVMRFNSTSIVAGIDELMVSRSRTRVPEFIEELLHKSTAYQDISLVSHPSGRIAVSRQARVGTRLAVNGETCVLCHVDGTPTADSREPRDEVTRAFAGARVLRVTTPIVNTGKCSTADCHTDRGTGQVLGILRTDYMLSGFDTLMGGMNLLLVLAAALAVVLSIGALLITFRTILAKPLRGLVRGIRTLAAGELGFRFPAVRDDEFGLVESSFNKLATRIQTQQREILKTLESLQGIVENTADLVITIDRHDNIQTFNCGAEQALGYMRGEVLGRRVEMLLAGPEEREKAVARMRGHENVLNWEAYFKTKDGQIRDVLVTLSRLRDRHGNPTGTLAVGKDVTTEKDLQTKLIRSEQEAAIGRAITAIQHAVKNMLNTLRGGLYVARLGQKKQQPERILEGCDMVEEGLAQISDLSLNMLKYAREWRIEPEPLDLADMVEKIEIAVRHTASEQGVSIRTEVDDSLPDVPCDRRLIHMGLMDFCSNALDACLMKDYNDDETPEIILRACLSEDGKSALIEIQDNGTGMTQEVADHVFTPFFSTKRKWGTGLGLALTLRIINLHDGNIDVESEPDRGSVFRITLPLEGPRKKPGEK